MANFYGNPMVLDTVWTAGTIPTTADSAGNAAPGKKTSPIQAKKIVFSGSTTTADALSIQDVNGNVLAQGVATTAAGNIGAEIVVFQSDLKTLPLKMQNWVLATLTHGKCLIYY